MYDSGVKSKKQKIEKPKVVPCPSEMNTTSAATMLNASVNVWTKCKKEIRIIEYSS